MFKKAKCFCFITTAIINISAVVLTYSFTSVAVGKELASLNTDADVYFQQAHTLFDRGNYRDAETLLHRVIQLTPDDSNAYYTLSFVLHHRSNMEFSAPTSKEAESVYQKALRLDSNDRWEEWKEWDHRGWGLVLFAQGNIEGAIAEYRKYMCTITHMPSRRRLVDYHESFAQILYTYGRIPEAIAAVKEAGRIYNGDEYSEEAAHVYWSLASRLLMDDYTQESIALIQEVSRGDRDYHSFLALVLYLQGQQGKAIENLKIAGVPIDHEDYLKELRRMKEGYLANKQLYLQFKQQQLQEWQKMKQEILQYYSKFQALPPNWRLQG